MTKTQEELYKMICEQTKYNGFAWLDSLAKVVYDDFHYLSEFSSRSEWRDQNSIKSMRDDVVAINKSETEHKIVPVKHSGRLIGYKIADEEELDQRIEKYKRERLRKWIKASELDAARKNNGQLRFSADERIKEIKTYIEEYNG